MIDYCYDIMDKINSGFPISEAGFKIGEAAITGMLYEVSTSPSPGLVSPYSSGTHRDMNYLTFLRSTAAIARGMYICAQIGITYELDVLKKIRSIGRLVEKDMFKATEGVNTQKGLLFVAGVVCAGAGCCVRTGKPVNRINISRTCSLIVGDIVERELKNLKDKKDLSNGEKIYLKYGITGIRGEVEGGIGSVINVGLPLYEEGIKAGLEINKALVQSLIGIMTVVEDTVVINKAGMEGLLYMREEAGYALSLGGMYTPEGEKYIGKMEEQFIKRGISPGGAADLLAISAMIYELEKLDL